MPFGRMEARSQGLTRRILNDGSESQREAFVNLDAPRRREFEGRARRPSVRRSEKWLAISRPVSGPAGLYQVPIQLIAPDMAKEASLASQGAMDLSAIPSSMYARMEASMRRLRARTCLRVSEESS